MDGPPVGPLQNGTAADILGNPNAGLVSTGLDPEDVVAVPSNATPFFLPTHLIPYEKVPATANMAGIPRFRHSTNFARIAFLTNGDADQRSDGVDYMIGLLFVGCFLLAFFLIWSAVLVIFKTHLQGIFKGDPFTNPHLTDPASLKLKEDAEHDGEEYIEDTNWLRRPRRIRITFFICGFLQILFAMLMVTHGVANLQVFTNSVQVSTDGVRALLDRAAHEAQGLKILGHTASMLGVNIIFDLSNLCPSNPPFAQTPDGRTLVAFSSATVAMLKGLAKFDLDYAATLEMSLNEGQSNLDVVDNSADAMESYEWLGGLIAFPYFILASLMMAGAVAGQLNIMTDCFLCTLNWLILPIYIFLVVMSYIGLAAISIAASMNADFCGGQTSTPDQVIVNFMHYGGFTQDDILFQTVRYYANQCTQLAEVDPFFDLRKFDWVISQGHLLLLNLTSSMDDISLEQLSVACSRDFNPLHRYLTQLVAVFEALKLTANRTLDLLSCQQVVPLYTDIVYSATCKYSVSGFAWIFSSLLIVSIMGMIMIMFRSSYQNTVFVKPPEVLMDDSSSDHFRPRTPKRRSSKKKRRRNP